MAAPHARLAVSRRAADHARAAALGLAWPCPARIRAHAGHRHRHSLSHRNRADKRATRLQCAHPAAPSRRAPARAHLPMLFAAPPRAGRVDNCPLVPGTTLVPSLCARACVRACSITTLDDPAHDWRCDVGAPVTNETGHTADYNPSWDTRNAGNYPSSSLGPDVGNLLPAQTNTLRALAMAKDMVDTPKHVQPSPHVPRTARLCRTVLRHPAGVASPRAPSAPARRIMPLPMRAPPLRGLTVVRPHARRACLGASDGASQVMPAGAVSCPLTVPRLAPPHAPPGTGAGPTHPR